MDITQNISQAAGTPNTLFKRLINIYDRQVLSYYLEELNPMWSLTAVKGRIMRITDETHDTKTFAIRPNHRWSGFVPGQHVGIDVEIDGRRYSRRYSISSSDVLRGQFSITVKRVADGRVSNWLHDHLRIDDVVSLQPAGGDFVLPQDLPKRMLMISGGSGITPVMSQLRQLLNEQDDLPYDGDIVFLHYMRSDEDRIFGDELAALASRHDNLKVIWRRDDAGECFSPQQIADDVPDFRYRRTQLCGPSGFMAAVREHWEELGLSDKLQFEYFGAPPVVRRDTDSEIETTVVLQRTGREVNGQNSQSLLQNLEAAGETPAYGCRMGICHECSCTKASGVVRNSLTGEVSSEPNQTIQLCISTAESDVVLEY